MVNKQGKNKITWTDDTLNPVVGCTHGCEYLCKTQKKLVDKIIDYNKLL